VARRWGSGGVQRSLPGAAALGACGGGEVTASGHCGQALVRSRRSASCREQREREGGPGGFLRFLPCLTARVRAGKMGSRQ
jgi:hypothetical protein